MKSNATPWWAQGSGTPVHPAGAFSRRSLRTVAARALVAVAVTGGLVVVAAGTEQSRMRDEGSGLVSTRQSTDSLLGGCGRVFERRTSQGTAGVIASVKADGSPNVPQSRTIVPMTGSFWSPAADPGVRMYTKDSPNIPKPTQLMNNMWRGALVVHYAANAGPEDVQALKVVAASRADLGIIIVPWDTTRPNLPAGRKIAFATWGASQTCQRLDVAALEQFRSAYPQVKAPGYGGVVAPTLPEPTASPATAH